MFEHFEKYLLSHGTFTQEELCLIRSLSVFKKVRRRQLLLHEGEICKHKIFVVKGLLKTYLTKNDGSEYIMRFALEDQWLVEHESFSNQTPSKYNIEAVEDAELILWSRENFDQMSAAIPELQSFSNRLKSNSMDASQERIMMTISATNEEKYQGFITSFPELNSRVPLHMVASYLGVSRETLSRIRHARVKGQKES